MAETTAGPAANGGKTVIDLHIISPTLPRLNLSDIPISTTVVELKAKISEASPSHPPSLHQRLIYRGHPLIRSDQTLKDLFTQDVIDTSDTLVLHLVLPPTAPSSTNNTIASPNIQRVSAPTANDSTHSPGVELGSTAQQPATGPNVMQNAALPPQNPQLQVPPGHLPPNVQHAFAHFHAVNQQLAAQLNSIHNHPFIQGANTPQATGQNPPIPTPPAFSHPQQAQVPIQMPQNFPVHGLQQFVPPQQQSRAHTPQQNAPTNPLAQANMVPPPPGSTQTVVREHIGPNGERWQTITQTATLNFTHQHPGAATNTSRVNGSPNSRSGTPTDQHAQQRSQSPNSAPGNLQNAHQNAQHRIHTSNTTQESQQNTPQYADRISPTPNTAPQGSQNASGPPPSNVILSGLEAILAMNDNVLARGIPPSVAIFEQAGATNISGLSQEHQNRLRTRLENQSRHANRMRQDQLNSQLHQAAEQRAATQRTSHGADSSAVYVLSSPNGPQALLVSPSGYHSTNWQIPQLPLMNPHSQPLLRQIPHLPYLSQPVAGNSVGDAQQPHTNGAQPAQRQAQAQQQIDVAHVADVHQHQQQADQARDVVRILVPLGGHLWLLIRLFGFVYFFTHGASWQRTIFLGLVAFLVFVGQTGAFRPFVAAVWDPIRRHADNLIPLAANEPPRREEVGADRAPNTNNAGAQQTDRDPNPQEAAERLLLERERQDLSLMRQVLSRAERAIALFLASLVPGVGERHIAAREAAEAARQTELREREEAARREEEERQRQAGTGATANVGSETSAESRGINTGNPASGGSDQAGQGPLIEV